MKAYTTLYDDVVPEIPGAELALVLHNIKRACIDFYERSLYAREMLPDIDIVANTATYAIVASDAANFSVAKVLEVRVADASPASRYAQIEARTKGQLGLELPNWDVQTGSASFYTQDAIDSVTLAFVPDTDITDGLRVLIAKLPLYGGGGIDDAVFDKFSEDIAAGVKHRMMRMPKKPWSNPGLALDYKQQFDLAVGAAGSIAAKGFGRAPLRSRAYG